MKTRGRASRSGAAEPDDARPAVELSAQENADLCSGCVKCCTYITVEIDPPRASWEYDQWIWALHHQTIQLFVERPERWLLHIDTLCRQLDSQGRCSIYGRHPVLCREYDPRSCERRLPLAVRAWFANAEQFEEWIRVHRPRHWKRLLDYRRDMPPGPPVADGQARGAIQEALVHIEAGPASGRPRRNGSRA
jgi:Fe-S-cluster containining protein